MRKSILLLLAGIMMLSSFGICAEEPAVLSEERQIVEMLTYIEPYDEEKEITRAEFCRTVYEIQYADEPVATAWTFTDVDINSASAGYVQRMYEFGIIAGDGTGSFNPDNKIKLCEAYSMLLKLLGYKELIKGSYPEEIIAVAIETGLAKNINLPADSTVDTETVYKIIYNLLFTEVMEFVYEDGGKYKKGGKFIKDILKIYSATGIVEAAEGYSLYNTKYNDDTVVISGNIFVGGDAVTSELIGMSGKYYYRENANNENELLGFLPKNNSVIRLMAEDIKSYASNTYTYYENGKTKTAKLTSGKDVIYNREQKTDENNMKPAYGYVDLIDNNDDGDYDVVMVYEYKNIFAIYVNPVKESITYNVSTPTGIQKKELMLSNKEYTVYNEKGKEISINELITDSVLTVMESDGQIKIYQCSDTESGQITSMADGYITVKETQYKLTGEIFTDGWNGSELIEVTLYLDMFGNVAAVKKGAASKWQFAYLMKTAFLPDENVIQMKLLCTDGERKILSTHTSKFKIDNFDKPVSQKTSDEIIDGQVIRFKTNSEGEIISVDTAVDVAASNLAYRGDGSEDCLLRRSDRTMIYKSNIKAFRAWHGNPVITLDGEAYWDDNTVVFNVPATVDADTEDEDYYVADTVVSNKKDRVVSYNTDATSMDSDIIVLYNSSDGKVTASARTMLVKSVSKAWVNDEELNVLNGLYNGQNVKMYVDDSMKSVSDKLQRGDFVRLGVNDNIVTAIELVYTADGNGILNNAAYFGSAVAFNAEERYIKGYVAATEGNKMMVVFSDGKKDVTEFMRTDGFNIYVYDPNLPSDECVYVGTAGDILDKRTDSVNYDTVIIGTREAISHDMLIIKKKL